MTEAHAEPRSCAFPTDRAFVVQFRAPSAGERRFEGKIEHVVSGKSLAFDSPQALVRALEALLRTGVGTLP